MFIIWKNDLRNTLELLGKWVKSTAYNPFLYKDITKQIDNVDEPLQLMIAGVFGSGKSTFLNTFIGEKLLNSSNRAETAIITKLTYGEEKTLLAHYKDGRVNKLPMEWLSSLITDREGGGTFLKPYINLIEIALPIEILKHVEMIDSPGVDANQEHNSISEGYFDHIDAAFWLFFYESAGKVVESTFVQKLKERRISVFGIINHVDDLMDIVDDEEAEQVQESIGDIFQQVQVRSNNAFEDKIIGITASNALEAKLNNSQQDLELSNWHVIDDLLTEIKDDSSIKYKKQYFGLAKLLQSINAQIEAQQKELEIDTFSQFVNQFCAYDANDFYSYYQEKSTEINEFERFFDKWMTFGNYSITNTLDLEKLQADLREIESISPLVPAEDLSLYSDINKYIEGLISNIKQWENQIQEYQSKLGQVVDSEISLGNEWYKIYNRKLIGIRRLNKFEESYVDYRNLHNQTKRQYEILKEQKENLQRQLDDFEASYDTFVDRLTAAYNKKYKQLNKELDDFLATYQAQYLPLTKDAVEEIYTFSNDIDQLESLLNPSFTHEESELVETEEYQKAYEEYEKIAAMNWNNQFSEKNRQDFIQFNEAISAKDDLPSTENSKTYLEVEDQSLLNLSVGQPQENRKFPSSSLLKRITRNRKRVLSFSLLFAIFLFAWQTNVLASLFSFVADEDRETTNIKEPAYTEQVAEEVQPIDVEAEVAEPDPEPFYYEFEEVEAFLNEFRNQYFEALNEKNFNYVSSYLEPNSAASQGLKTYIEEDLPAVYYFSDQETTVTAISEVLDGSFDVETTETFTYENERGDLIHYQRNKTYAISDKEGYFSIYHIEITHTEHTVEELETALFVSQEDIHSFLQQFKEEKVYAVNAGFTDYLKSYYDSTGTAWPEMNAYVNRLFSQEDQLEINQFFVTSINQEDSRHYLVNIESNQEVFLVDGTREIINKREQYRLAVDQNATITIVDKTMKDIIYQEEILPETSEDSAVSSEEIETEVIEEQGGIE